MSKELNLSGAPFDSRECLTLQQIVDRAAELQQERRIGNSQAIDIVLHMQNAIIEARRSNNMRE